MYREHPQSPVPADRRASFRAAHFEHDPALRFEVRVEPIEAAPAGGGFGVGPIDFGGGSPASGPATPEEAGPVQLPVSGGGVMAFRRFGAVTVPFPGGSRRLEVYWMDGYAGGLFLPFRDETNGSETYGAG